MGAGGPWRHGEWTSFALGLGMGLGARLAVGTPLSQPVSLLCFHSSVVMLEIDNRLCLQLPENDHCFPDAQSAADYLGALSAVERLDFPYPLWAARGEAGWWATRVEPGLPWWGPGCG